jgi:hypothetical protein
MPIYYIKRATDVPVISLTMKINNKGRSRENCGSSVETKV